MTRQDRSPDLIERHGALAAVNQTEQRNCWQ
jgi:hypothetical protein